MAMSVATFICPQKPCLLFCGRLNYWHLALGAAIRVRMQMWCHCVETATAASGWTAVGLPQMLCTCMYIGHYTAYAVVLTKYCLSHCARTCCSLRNVTRWRFTNWRIRCERGGRNVHFLSINLISCCRSRGIVLVMASSAREMDSAGRQWNTEKDLRNVRDFSVKRLPSESTISVWLNKRDTLLCVPTGTRNSACFEVGLIRTVIDHVTVSERAA